jgi:transcriptional regulator with XRE-family HTH domain
MAVGDRIKRIRNVRRLTQKELGLAIGFDENTADVRVAQYESGTRTPKEDMLKKIAEVLDVNYRAIYEPMLYATEDVMYILFELDEHYNSMQIYDVTDDSDTFAPEHHKAVSFNVHLLDDFLTEWQLRKKELVEGKISRDEYFEWKVNWPQTADDSGKIEPSKNWRKGNSSEGD